jgi:hypothetical protein
MMRRLNAFLLPLSLLAVTGCGGSASPTPLPTPTPVPTPTPAPQPTPTPSPTPTPCTQGLCEEPTTNTAPVSRVILRLFQVFDEQNRWILPTPDPVQQVVNEPIPVGWTIKLDVTGKDASNKDTLGQKKILYRYSNADMVEENYLSEWQVRLKILKPGNFTVHAVFDGVGSNDLRFTFVEK